MTINYTILGLLESGDRSGYDLKKSHAGIRLSALVRK